MRYGLPYKGSKNAIAMWVVEQLPPAETFVDLFAGGCAVTHAAMLSGKYKRFICNDIDADMPRLFVDAVQGKYREEKRWISRDDFLALKDTDPYVRVCWSFGCNKKNYLYSRELEPWKKALHYARVFGDYSLLGEFGIRSDGGRVDIKAHHEAYKEKYVEWLAKKKWPYSDDYNKHVANLTEKVEFGKEKLRQYLRKALKESGLTQAEVQRRLGTQMASHYFRRSQWAFPTEEHYDRMRGFMPLPMSYWEIYGLQQLEESLQSLGRLQSLQSLQRLQGLESLGRLRSLQRLECYGLEYQKVPIPADSVVYCDPPYKGTDSYGTIFDHGRFYDWLRCRDRPVWVSEYSMPDDFVCVGGREKRVNLNKGSDKKVTEKIFVHERWANAAVRGLFL